MVYERRERPDDTIVLFRNEDRRNEKDPAYKGQGRVSGREYWVSGWVNESRKDGSKYLSVKLKPKTEARRERYSRRDDYERGRAPNDLDDEVPF
jgi:hypothetical protein